MSTITRRTIKTIYKLFNIFTTIQIKLKYFHCQSTLNFLFSIPPLCCDIRVEHTNAAAAAMPLPLFPFLDTPRGALEVLTASRVVPKFPHSPSLTYLVPASRIALQRFGQPLIRRRWRLRLTNCQRRQRQRRRRRRLRR